MNKIKIEFVAFGHLNFVKIYITSKIILWIEEEGLTNYHVEDDLDGIANKYCFIEQRIIKRLNKR